MLIKKIKVNMNYGSSSKQKNPFTNYMTKYLSKQSKITSHKTNNNIYNNKNDPKNFANTFRKGINKEKPIQKYKTTKNSPNHVFKSINNSDEIFNEKKDNIFENNYIFNNNNQILQSNKINDFIKENNLNNFDALFMKKIQKIYSKQHSTQNSLSKFSHSNFFKSNSQLENSLKNNTKSIYNNISNSKLMKRSNSSLDDETHISKPLSPNFENSKLKDEKGNISSDFSQIKKYSFINSISHGNFYNNSNLKNNNNSKGKNINNTNNNNITLKGYLYNCLSKKQNPQLIEKYKLNKSSGTFVAVDPKFDFKKLSKTSYPSKDNSRKNSAERKNSNPKKNIIKNFEITNFVITNQKGNINISKPSISSLLKPKNPSINSNINNIEQNHPFHIKNISDISSKFVSSNTSKLLKPSQINKTNKNFFKMNNIKYLEYITSGLKNNNSTKNISSLSNKSSKKKEEIEKDYLQMKLQLKLKTAKSLTTVQSKQNSKSSSRIEEYSNIGNTSQSNLVQNKKINYDILKKEKKFNFNSSNSNHIENINNNSIIEENKNELENDKNQLNIPNNETIQSIQSTMKESSYYRKEMENISNYIKRCKIFFLI